MLVGEFLAIEIPILETAEKAAVFPKAISLTGDHSTAGGLPKEPYTLSMSLPHGEGLKVSRHELQHSTSIWTA